MESHPQSGPDHREEFGCLSTEFARGKVSFDWTPREFTVEVAWEPNTCPHGSICQIGFESFDEAEARYKRILSSGGPTIAEYVVEAAYKDAPNDDSDDSEALIDSYSDVAEALTPEQLEIATTLYFDHEMPFMEAIEAARLVTS